MSERNGIEIDYCPQCRGIWLDRGELDKIIERAETAIPVQQYQQPQQQAQQQYQQTPQQYQQHPQQHNDRKYDDRNQGGYRKKKRENWLSELFE